MRLTTDLVSSAYLLERRDAASEQARAAAISMSLRMGRVVTWTYDPSDDQLWVSESMREAFLLDTESKCRSARDLLAPTLSAQLEPGSETEFDHVVVDRTGARVALHVRARAVSTANGVVQLSGVVADVTERRATETALNDLIERYRLLLELSPDAIVVHQDGVLRYANPAAVAFARAPRAESLVGLPIAQFIHPDCLASMAGRIIGLARQGQVSEPTEVRLVALDGTTTRLVESKSVLTSWEGRPAFQVIMRDITERRAADERFEAVVGALNEGVLVFESDGRISVVNRAARKLLGARPGQAATADELLASAEFVDEHGSPLPTSRHPAVRTLESGEPSRNILVGFSDGSDETRWLLTNSQPLQLPAAPTAAAAVWSFSDVTDKRHAETRLHHEASYDSLTELLNRAVVLGELQAILDGSNSPRTSTGLLFVDIDRFKAINDSMGHLAGDEVLKTVASRLVAATRSSDAVGRLGGDEFVIVLDRLSDPTDAGRVAEELRACLVRPMQLPDGKELSVTCSIGVAVADSDTRDAEELLQCADAALYRAKARGRDRIEVYDATLRLKVRRRLNIQTELGIAIERGDIYLRYQPIRHLESERLTGVEALARWHHATLGDIPPAEFIAVAEESGLISALGRHTITLACKEFAHWREAHSDLAVDHLAVNLSPRQLATADIVDHVDRALRSAGLPASVLCLEITESTLATHVESARRALHALRDLGVRLAIDDFGTGYSSLATLKQFRADILKIDQSFIGSLDTADDSYAIVDAVIRLADSLNLATIAEGIENAAQRERLIGLGTRRGQGWLLGVPQALHQLDS